MTKNTAPENSLPTYARRMIEEASPNGRVEQIQVRPKKGAPVQSVESWDLAGAADHSRSDKRAVTLFQWEHLAAISNYLDRPIEFSMTRRNLCIKGFNLEVARCAQLYVGNAVLEITDRCHPCSRMNETLGPGGFAAMFGHGGWTARIVKHGILEVGSVVSL